MNGPNPKRPLQATAWQLLVLIGISVLFLPALGPLLDHHFAERQFNHSHLYFGAVDLGHSHPLGTPHKHGDHHTHGEDRPVTEDIIYLTSEDGHYGGSTPVTSPSLHSNVVLPEPPDFLPIHRSIIDSGILPETFVPPPAPPPRA
ncbi:MAG: hypothetical protein ACE5Q6_04345 [Dehalococcoidia bacterium]